MDPRDHSSMLSYIISDAANAADGSGHMDSSPYCSSVILTLLYLSQINGCTYIYVVGWSKFSVNTTDDATDDVDTWSMKPLATNNQ